MANRTKYLILFGVFFLLSYILNNPYRKFIYENHINDFGLADTSYNIFRVTLLTLVLWILGLSFTKSRVLDIFILYIGFVVIEVLSSWFPLFGSFDQIDLLALTISLIITLLIYYFLKPITLRKIKLP
jgi:hypothetical protein